MSNDPSSPGRSWLGAVPMIALYALLGLLVGVIGSFTHRSRFAIGEMPVWYGIVVAIACALAFAIGLRRSSRGMGVGLAFACGVTAGIFAISLGYSHSAVILADTVGMIWLLLTPILVFGAALWPRLPSRSRGRQAADARIAPAAPVAIEGGSPTAAPYLAPGAGVATTDGAAPAGPGCVAHPDSQVAWRNPLQAPSRDQELDR